MIPLRNRHPLESIPESAMEIRKLTIALVHGGNGVTPVIDDEVLTTI